MSEGTYRNGVKDGFWKEYNESGEIMFDGSYRNGIQEQ